MKTTFLKLIAVTMLLVAVPAFAVSDHSAGKWDKQTIETFRSIPILDSGRVKPFDTFAQYAMLRINAKRSYVPYIMDSEGNFELDSNGEPKEASRRQKMDHVEWILDCLFYPEVARNYPVFIVDDANIVTTLGIERKRKQRDRYSYTELEPAREELVKRATAASRIEQADRTYQQSAMLALLNNMMEFEGLIYYFEFTKHPFNTENSQLAQKLFENPESLTLSEVMANSSKLMNAIAAFQQVSNESGSEKYQSEIEAFGEFLFPIDAAGRTAIALTLIPPGDPESKEWKSISNLVDGLYKLPEQNPKELAVLAALEQMVANKNNPLQFKQALNEYSKLVIGHAKARDEYGTIPLEVSYYKAKYLPYALYLFVFSFLLAAVLWLKPQNKWLTRATWISVVIPWGLLVIAIVLRCIIRGRPPVSTLYETVLFITAVSILVALFIEWANRQRISLSIAAFMGALGLFIANRYEITNQQDTMPTLVAVLDTNFWLATHVTIINVGYAAGMLAAAIAHIFVFGKLFNYKKDEPKFYRNLTRMVYGVTCFGLLFAFVGTVLGGIWANYSWGRFWGWDPKENGAAMICLCQLAILHARMGGYIRHMGIHLAALFTGGVVGFSWWGVNLLGVGMHSYGFTEGIWTATFMFWGVEGVTMVLGFFVLFRDKFSSSATPPSAEATPAT
jgi:ABC-type transport system involved in cytochrome c biogenesis permease subunit